MNKDALLELASRCEKATGPDRDIDCHIHVEMFVDKENAGCIDIGHGYVGWHPLDGPYVSAVEPLRYTASIDAAMSLVPEGFGYVLTPGKVALIPDGKGPDFRSDAATPALALCAAALRAQTGAQGNENG